MKKLLVFTAVAEGVTGIILFAFPPVFVWLLFGESVADAGLILGRLVGLCLIALAVACWPDGNSLRGCYGMLVWSVLAALYLIVVGVRGTAGILLWPMVVVHFVLAVLLLQARSAQRKRAQ